MVMIVTNKLRLGMRPKNGKYGIGELRIVASGRWLIGPADDRTSRALNRIAGAATASQMLNLVPRCLFDIFVIFIRLNIVNVWCNYKHSPIAYSVTL